MVCSLQSASFKARKQEGRREWERKREKEGERDDYTDLNSQGYKRVNLEESIEKVPLKHKKTRRNQQRRRIKNPTTNSTYILS
jgi:hypothetical protein